MLTPQAHGQSNTPTEEVGAPQMTVGAAIPSSRIAKYLRPQFAPLGMRDVRSVMMSVPDTTAMVVTPAPTAPGGLPPAPNSRSAAKLAPVTKPGLTAGPNPIFDFSLPDNAVTAPKTAPIKIAALPPAN